MTIATVANIGKPKIFHTLECTIVLVKESVYAQRHNKSFDEYPSATYIAVPVFMPANAMPTGDITPPLIPFIDAAGVE